MADGSRTELYIALLRAVNVASHGQISMADLRGMLTDLGFSNVRSLLNSGNLLFSGDAQPATTLEELLEQQTTKRLDVSTDYLVRTLDEWASIIDHNPFPDEAKRDPSHLLVVFLKAAPETPAIEALQSAVSGPEVIRAEGRQLYITYPAGIGRSRLTNALIEGKLGTHGTGRNWNTVLKLHALGRE